MYGIDEDRCDELEYNECEENEYRCQDGSCISEEYWLDGQYDCSDKSDEQEIDRRHQDEHFCALVSSQFDCDEATAHYRYFACGDGEFVDGTLPVLGYCYNYRLIMFFCESSSPFSSEFPKWTLENGHCVDKAWIEKDLTDMDESEQCVFYLKCKLTLGASDGCHKALDLFASLCQNKTIKYPSEPVFRPYFQTIYVPIEMINLLKPSSVLFNGSVKCGGHQTSFEQYSSLFTWVDFNDDYFLDILFCRMSETMDVFDPQRDKQCWHDTKQSFLCKESLQCISKHRLRNNIRDCRSGEDELDGQECYMTKQHRLNCSGNESLCLLLSRIGDDVADCKEGNDEYIRQLKWNLVDRPCRERNSLECNVLKSYIQSPSSVAMTENNKVLPFRQYCDTLWQLPKGFDESLCNNWKCPKDQYQCLSGHCIRLYSVIDPLDMEWHCPDASDNMGLLGITHLSEHNSELVSYDELQFKKTNIIDYNGGRDDVPFTTFCDERKEYGCILANVDDPLNFTINRPCINLTQIGNGIIDCYGGLDERNLLTCGNNVYEQRGFDFHCSNQECIPYHRLCTQRCSYKEDSVLCDQLKTLWDSSCLYSTHYDLCSSFDSNCDLLGVSNYYCNIAQHGK
jgi:hypothetical protein